LEQTKAVWSKPKRFGANQSGLEQTKAVWFLAKLLMRLYLAQGGRGAVAEMQRKWPPRAPNDPRFLQSFSL